MWIYEELYSCPKTVLIGKAFVGKHPGLLTLSIGNYRANLLRKGSEWFLYHNIPVELNPDETVNACLQIAKGLLHEQKGLEKVIATSMFYGGLTFFIEQGTEHILLNMEPVNRDVFRFYINPKGEKTVKESGFEQLSLFMLSMREGLKDLMLESCAEIGRRSSGSCIIPTSVGELIVSTEEITRKELMRVVPDNAPLRHVVKV
ncbi:hypothetical protein IMZ38_04055 [Thermosphaera chiliense]|uniref:Uncharacterized protein n=1 Tax=Thermosphaera chiliense TaxID=3402707 RepID=A0A7M1USZ4_9CREN|nr:hypothetical protein [Thermosphaera aggregans]QOR93834.1 hypothetical protein IMZ38_04055 [Thermosphaera aggregans]